MSGTMRIAFLVFALFITLAAGSRSALDLSAKELRSPADSPRVVMILIDKVTWAELAAIRPPNLVRLARLGAIGMLSNRTAEVVTSSSGAYLSIGAGVRAVGLPTGIPLDAANMNKVKRLNEAGAYRARVGLLGQRLRAGGQSTVVLGNADGRRPDGTYVFGREAELIGVDKRGRVSADTSTRLLNPDLQTNYSALKDGFVRRSKGAGLTVIETGDTRRADLGGRDRPERKRQAILDADTFVGDIARSLDLDRDLLLVVSPSPPTKRNSMPQDALTPVIAVGGGRGPALLTSPSTRRAGLVTNLDIAPTIADHLGIEWGIDAPGRAMRTAAPALSFAQISRRADAHLMAEDLSTSVIWAYGLLAVLGILAGAAALSISRLRTSRVEKYVGPLLLAGFSMPLSIFIAPLLPFSLGSPIAYLGYVFSGTAVLTFFAWRLRQDRLLPILLISSATCAFLVINIVAGAPGDLNSSLGYTTITAARFYGIGNHYLAILLGAALLASLLWFDRADRQPAAKRLLIMFYAALIILVGHGSFGANTGGIITMTPALILAYFWTVRGRLRGGHILLATAAAATALVVFALGDSWFAAEPAHLGAAARQVYQGSAEVFYVTVNRKIRANLAILKYAYLFAVPIALVAAAGLALFIRRYRAGGKAVKYRGERIALAVGLIGGVFGSVANDSGAAVLVLVAAYLLSAVLYLELGEVQEPSQLL